MATPVNEETEIREPLQPSGITKQGNSPPPSALNTGNSFRDQLSATILDLGQGSHSDNEEQKSSVSNAPSSGTDQQASSTNCEEGQKEKLLGGVDPRSTQERSKYDEKYLPKDHRRTGASFQEKVFNFLERPTGWVCVLYHMIVSDYKEEPKAGASGGARQQPPILQEVYAQMRFLEEQQAKWQAQYKEIGNLASSNFRNLHPIWPQDLLTRNLGSSNDRNTEPENSAAGPSDTDPSQKDEEKTTEKGEESQSEDKTQTEDEEEEEDVKRFYVPVDDYVPYKYEEPPARPKPFKEWVYRFLEFPKGCFAWMYHSTLFFMVLTCLTFSVLSTIEEFEKSAEAPLIWMEIFLVVFFAVEYIVRLWSAGCCKKYLGIKGRLRFIRKPICVIDLIVVVASIAVMLSSDGQAFAASAIRGVRFLQMLRMLHVDRQGGTWRLLGSVIYTHKTELVTTMYIGFLGLIFSSYFLYQVERVDKSEKGNRTTHFNNYADALWWGIITVTTIGYGDVVPQTWLGKIVASCFSVFAISFFALPAGILGSGLALKVQQKQRQKHFNRQFPAAARLIQCLWRCRAADKNSNSTATWAPHEQEPKVNQKKKKSKDKSFFHHVTKEASCLRKRKSKDGTDEPDNSPNQAPNAERPEPEVVVDEPAAPRRSRTQVEERVSFFTSQASTMTEAFSEEIETDDLDEAPRVTQLTEAHKNAIRAIRKIKFFVARKKFQLARKPYDVRDVMEQYSQGHFNMMLRIKELQRRLDQTLGKPGSYLAGMDMSGNQKNVTIGARLCRVEQQVYVVDKKSDHMGCLLTVMVQNSEILLQNQQILMRNFELLAQQLMHQQTDEDGLASPAAQSARGENFSATMEDRNTTGHDRRPKLSAYRTL